MQYVNMIKSEEEKLRCANNVYEIFTKIWTNIQFIFGVFSEPLL